MGKEKSPKFLRETLGFSERFWRKFKLEPSTGCLLWTGCLDSKGYGLVRKPSGVLSRVHRVAYTLKRGSIPPGVQVRHSCRHSHSKRCGNVEHLELFIYDSVEG